MTAAPNLAPWMEPADLAPGDRKSLAGDWSGFDLNRIGDPRGQHFAAAYAALWEEFGANHEMEDAGVISGRLARNPADGMLYELLSVTGPGGELAAVCDHTAIFVPGDGAVVVHLSHILVLPDWRRSGLAGWMRALPVSTAKRLLQIRGLPSDTPITLLGEMEPFDPGNSAVLTRLAAYSRAGYRKVDPRVIDYRQPDFRPPEAIDESGGPSPLRMLLLLHRLGREQDGSIGGAELRAAVGALYRMYARDFRPEDMAGLLAALDAYPADGSRVALLDPLEV